MFNETANFHQFWRSEGELLVVQKQIVQKTDSISIFRNSAKKILYSNPGRAEHDVTQHYSRALGSNKVEIQTLYSRTSQ